MSLKSWPENASLHALGDEHSSTAVGAHSTALPFCSVKLTEVLSVPPPIRIGLS